MGSERQRGQEEQRETHRPLEGVSLGETEILERRIQLTFERQQLAEGICTFSYRGKDEREGCIPCLSHLQQYLPPNPPQTHLSLLCTFLLITMHRIVDLKGI